MKEFYQEYVTINGIEHYFLHYPVDGKPVVLFLHGGPGTSESAFGYVLKDIFKDSCTLVFYDQRGAGRTLTKNPKAIPTLDLLLEDLQHTISYLKKLYKTQKFILMGHSWGTVLGSIYALKNPEDVSLYIGVGQVYDLYNTEKLAFSVLKKKVTNQNNKKDLKKINNINNYPPKQWDNKSNKLYNYISKLKDKYGLSMAVKLSLAKMAIKSHIKFGIRDLISMTKGMKINEPLMLFALNNFDLDKYGFEYKMPVCYIFGDNDYVTPAEVFHDYYNKIIAPDKNMIIIKNAGHLTMFEQPESFFEAIIPYIKNIEIEANNN